jgi:F-type H+-transporting ATPase subunit a
MSGMQLPSVRLLLASALCALFLVAPARSGAQDTPDSVAAAAFGPSTPTPVMPASAQEQSGDKAGAQAKASAGQEDFITPHITDAHHLELPYWKAPFAIEVELPRLDPITIAGMSVDISPTKHVVFMLFAAFMATLMLVGAARSSTAGHKMIGRPKGFASAIEAMALYLRNEVVMPNVGPHGEKYVPFALTLFYFILWCNLLGLFPYGATATGNIAVTATLALVTLVVVEITGMRTLGAGYLSTVFYWNTELPMLVRVPMFLIMSPVEMVSKLSKPFALAIRLFANMTAGHIVLLALIGLIFTFKSYYIAVAPVGMAVAISLLELFVSFLQAFIFTMLVSVFIGQMRQSHH